jgi:hypothetical protein
VEYRKGSENLVWDIFQQIVGEVEPLGDDERKNNGLSKVAGRATATATKVTYSRAASMQCSVRFTAGQGCAHLLTIPILFPGSDNYVYPVHNLIICCKYISMKVVS